MEDGRDSTAATANATTPQSRRGRGKGPRGRGQPKRGGASNVNVNVNIPTFHERAAQLRTLEGAPVEAPKVATVPLAQLSAAMDALYPSSQEPALPPQSVMIDCSGYMDLCATVYEAIVSYDDKLERILSEPEFLLSCAWILARRVIKIRTMAMHIVVPSQEDFLSAIPETTPVPTAIANYLEGIGIIRHNTGEIILPNIVLPRRDFGHNHLTGMLPSLHGDSFAANTHWEFNSSMIQFGMLARAILNAHAGNAYTHGNALSRLDANVATPANDAHYLRPSCLPKFTHLRPMHRDRVGRLLTGFSNEQTLAGTLRYNATLFQHFNLFLDRSVKICALSSPPTTTAGTPAYFAWAAPENGDDTTPPTSFFYYSSCKLSDAEQHAARLFRYRQRRPRNDSCAEADQSDRDAAFDAATPSLKWATMIITAMPSYTSYLGHYVRHFMKL